MSIGLWPIALSILYPVQAMKSLGLYSTRDYGRFPIPIANGGGQFFCRRHKRPVTTKTRSRGDSDFDSLAELYDSWVSPCATPVTEETLELIDRLLPDDGRILDLGCGPGKEIPLLAERVPLGEVVGADISEQMLRVAFDYSSQQGASNTAFFQVDAARLPRAFAEKFDLIFCSSAFHHYDDPENALLEMHGALRVGGKAVIIDPGVTAWYRMSEPIARWGDPGFVSFYTVEEFQRMFASAGFSEYYWNEVLPGIGVSIGTK